MVMVPYTLEKGDFPAGDLDIGHGPAHVRPEGSGIPYNIPEGHGIGSRKPGSKGLDIGYGLCRITRQVGRFPALGIAQHYKGKLILRGIQRYEREIVPAALPGGNATCIEDGIPCTRVKGNLVRRRDGYVNDPRVGVQLELVHPGFVSPGPAVTVSHGDSGNALSRRSVSNPSDGVIPFQKGYPGNRIPVIGRRLWGYRILRSLFSNPFFRIESRVRLARSEENKANRKI